MYVHMFIFCFRCYVEIINRLIDGNKFTSKIYILTVSKHTDFYLHMCETKILLYDVYVAFIRFHNTRS
jgi:hypothetical protein